MSSRPSGTSRSPSLNTWARRYRRRHDPIFPSRTPSPQTSPGSPIHASWVQHLETCGCHEHWELLDDLKTAAIAWFRACKSSTENVLWVSVHLFLVDRIKFCRTMLEAAVCTCGAWPIRAPDSSQSSQSSDSDSGSSYGS